MLLTVIVAMSFVMLALEHAWQGRLRSAARGSRKEIETKKRFAVNLAQPRTLPGFELELGSTLNYDGGGPIGGSNLVLVAEVNGVLHFRIFDGASKRVVDTDEKTLAKKARQIEALHKQLAPLWRQDEVIRSDQERIIAAVKSIVDYAPALVRIR